MVRLHVFDQFDVTISIDFIKQHAAYELPIVGRLE